MKPEDWYSINLTELHDVGFPKSLNRVQLAELLKEKYPQQEWDAVYLLRGKYAQQKRAEKAIRSLFPVRFFLIPFLSFFLSFFGSRFLFIFSQITIIFFLSFFCSLVVTYYL